MNIKSIINQTVLPWPVREALKVVNRVQTLNKQCAIFETGYGPSGLPHMGTVAEVIRTLMIKKAYDQLLPEIPSKLIAFVDDLDGLRKVPENVPNKALLQENLNKPLSQVPDPFQQCNSFAEYNSNRFKMLLHRLGCSDKITIVSAAQQYKTGQFNSALLNVLKHHQAVLEVMKEHLREERMSTYSPFLPISTISGKILQVAMEEYNVINGTISYKDEDHKTHIIPVIDGYCKLQWKPDLGMRWHAMKVDYELYGKDLISSAQIASEVCKILGSVPPEGMHYELFLSPQGERVSKSKGNESLTLDHWWNYTPTGCLEHFLYQNPERAKCMRLEDLPTYVDNFLTDLQAYPNFTDQEKMNNALYFIDNIDLNLSTTVSYKMCLSMACAIQSPDFNSLLAFLKINPADKLGLDVAEKAYKYYETEIKNTQQIKPIPHNLHETVQKLISLLQTSENEPKALQSCFFEIGKQSGISLGEWFSTIYWALLGTGQGPKLGTFCMMYGTQDVIKKLEAAIAV